MKQRLLSLAAAAGCVMTAVCLIWIANLSEQVSRLERTLSGRIDYLNTAVQNIGGQVRSALEQEASLLVAWEAEPGEPDFSQRTVPIRCTVVPKEFSPEATAATLFWSGGEVPMALKDGGYTATVQAPIFEEIRLDRVVFSEGGRLFTEPLDWYFSGRDACLLLVNAFLEGSFSAQGGSVLWEGMLQLDLNSLRGMAAPQSVTLSVWHDGQETLRQELVPDGERGIHDAGDYYCAGYPVTVKLPSPAESCELWAEILGQDGLVYRALLDRYQAGGDGSSPDIGSGDRVEIRDREGHLLDPL